MFVVAVSCKVFIHDAVFLCGGVGEGHFDVIKHECLDVMRFFIGCGKGEFEVFWFVCFGKVCVYLGCLDGVCGVIEM